MSLGTAIKTARVRRNIKQKVLAVKMGVSKSYLSLIENDKREPSLSFLKKLADELAIPLSMLFVLANDYPKLEDPGGVVLESFFNASDRSTCEQFFWRVLRLSQFFVVPGRTK